LGDVSSEGAIEKSELDWRDINRLEVTFLDKFRIDEAVGGTAVKESGEYGFDYRRCGNVANKGIGI